MTRYQPKPVTVDALRWSGSVKDLPEMTDFLEPHGVECSTRRVVTEPSPEMLNIEIPTADGQDVVHARVAPGEWIVFTDGHIDLVANWKFERDYEPVPE